MALLTEWHNLLGTIRAGKALLVSQGQNWIEVYNIKIQAKNLYSKWQKQEKVIILLSMLQISKNLCKQFLKTRSQNWTLKLETACTCIYTG